ncbi:hypothetical protein [Azospirillum argentinense]
MQSSVWVGKSPGRNRGDFDFRTMTLVLPVWAKPGIDR